LPLHQFFRLLESRPEFTCPSRLLGDVVGPAAEEALCQARVLGPKGPATWYACARGLRTCRRTVAADRAQLHLLCGRASGDCPPEIVAAEEYGQHALDEPALVRLLQRLFGVDGQPPRIEGRGQPIRLGRSPGGDCEVWAWLRPFEPAFANWMGDLENRMHTKQRRRALVLVPTHARIYNHTFERYGPGQPVEVVYLDRALTVDGHQIVRTPPRPGPTARVPWSAPVLDRQGARLRVAAGVRWSHITIEYVNDDTVAVRVGAHPPTRMSAADLGLKRELGGKPPPLWELLLALCAGNGTCSRRGAGAYNLGALRTTASRLSKRLSAVFGIVEPALHVDKRTESVRSDFLARPETRRSSTRRPPT
jgi:hypothetical protein